MTGMCPRFQRMLFRNPGGTTSTFSGVKFQAT